MDKKSLGSVLARGLERKSIGAAESGFFSRWNWSNLSWSGVNVNQQVALQNDTVWACVRKISDAVSTLPLGFYEKTRDGGREMATSHPLYDLLLARHAAARRQPRRGAGAAQDRDVAVIERLDQHDLVARFDERHERARERFGRARCHHDFGVRIEADAVSHYPGKATKLSTFVCDGMVADSDVLGRFIRVKDTPTYYLVEAGKKRAIASAAAQYLTTLTGSAVAPSTTRYEPAAFPTAQQLAGLDGATATMRLRGIGDVELALRFDDAPMAVHTFVTLASAGKFNGLTFHRIVPNFVIQGGSPGADEYDPITDSFMRDEVGLARNARGSFGISTRGRDTGDGQIYVNLVNNFRLDHDYTVFANVTRGLDLIDRVQEGDVIESIVVRRTTTSAPRRP